MRSRAGETLTMIRRWMLLSIDRPRLAAARTGKTGRDTIVTKRKGKIGDYEVGYGKPPKATQFQPGVSGHKGRRKSREGTADMVARLLDEKVELNGRKMTKLELMAHQAITHAIKSPSIKNLTMVLELLEKHGVLPKADLAAEQAAGAQRALEKIFGYIERTAEDDTEDVAELDRVCEEEVKLIFACPSCGPQLRANWKQSERQALAKRNKKTGLQQDAQRIHSAPLSPVKPDE